MSAIKTLIKEIKNLQPLPAVANKIMSEMNKPTWSMHDIARIIQYDPALTASILKTCNSAYFALKRPVESINDAVSILGTDQIVELILLKASTAALDKDHKGYGLYKGAMWKYSVSSALIAQKIAKKISPDNQYTVFTAALLKDIGKTVLDHFVANSSEKINTLVSSKGYSFLEAEKKIIGTNHAEIGALIAKMWNFSPRLINIIRHHHLTDESMRKEKDIAIVYLSDCICMMMGIGVGVDGLAYRFHDKVIRNLHIGPNDISKIIADFSFSIKEVEEMFQIMHR